MCVLPQAEGKFTLPLPFCSLQGLADWMVPTYTGIIPGASIDVLELFIFVISSISILYSPSPCFAALNLSNLLS